MQTKHIEKCSLCLLSEKEVSPFLKELTQAHPQVTIDLIPSSGALQIVFQAESDVSFLIQKVKKEFPTFFFQGPSLALTLHQELIQRKKKICFAESCSGGALAAKIAAIPDASQYFLGSIVAYSSAWKERFLQVSRTTLKEKGAVSKEVVTEMVEGLFQETDADLAVAISGIAGPKGGSLEKPVGTLYMAIGKRGEKIDAGRIQSLPDRFSAIELSVHFALGALWRRLVHNAVTFS